MNGPSYLIKLKHYMQLYNILYCFWLILISCVIFVRCLVNVSVQTTNIPTDLLPGNQKFNDLVQRDVLMNVYKDGVFGSYRRTPFLKSKTLIYKINNSRSIKIVEIYMQL